MRKMRLHVRKRRIFSPASAAVTGSSVVASIPKKLGLGVS